MTPKRMFPCALAVCLALGLLFAADAYAQSTSNSYRPVTTTTQTGGRARLETDPVIISRAEDEEWADEVPAPGRSSSLVRPTAMIRSTAAAASVNMPSIWPVTGNLRGGVGFRRNPFGGASFEFHKGQDISAPFGSPVIATAGGVVVTSGWQRGYGRVVYVDHGNGISTRYGHLSRLDVAVGQIIKRGDQLGLVGSSGRSTAPHLHYEVRVNGTPANPLNYLPIIAAQSSPIQSQLN
jgi:murein DD-endopeptidase MepM/ murein hydrolase activator NlpD